MEHLTHSRRVTSQLGDLHGVYMYIMSVNMYCTCMLYEKLSLLCYYV
jgi:hypothetical protein